MSYRMRIAATSALLAASCLGVIGGCSPSFLANLVEERSGDIAIQVVNNTEYRASFTLGAYDAYVLNPPGEVEIEQLGLEGGDEDASITLECARNVAIAGAALVERIEATEQNLEAGFDLAYLNENVHFSSAAAGSDAATLPTEGTAAGLEVRLGVDYGCGDLLIFILEENDELVDGHRFRIEYQLVEAEEDE